MTARGSPQRQAPVQELRRDYPQELTQAWWDKKKPVLAKVKKTGSGEALKAPKQLHDKIDWKDRRE